jgi:cell division transport system permease protein
VNRVRVLLSESLRSFSANLSTTIAATMTVLIGMFLLGLLIAFGTWARSWGDHVKKELVVHVYYCTESTCPATGAVTQAQINRVAAQLESDPRVKSVKFVPKAKALELMKQKAPDLVRNLPSNPLPDAEEVTPKRGEDTEAIAKTLSPRPLGVENVKWGKKTAHRILRVARVIELFFVSGVILLLIASMLLIGNTIRLSIFARRREIEVMKLVGATNWFVRGPFMIEGLLCGLAGSLAAILLLVLGKELALPAILGHVHAGSDVKAIGFTLNAVIVLATGLLLGAAGSGLTLHRFLRV